MSRLKESQAWAFPVLPARPLGLALERAIDPDTPVDEACERFRTSSRSLREWLTGAREFVQFNTADRVLCEIGLNWFEVWNERTVPDLEQLDTVRRAFTGECKSPCPDQFCKCLMDEFEQLEMAGMDSTTGKVPLPLQPKEALDRAAHLRNSDASYSWTAIALIMRDYHGWDLPAYWWSRELVQATGRCKPARHGKLQQVA
jgi:hypothetical protein